MPNNAANEAGLIAALRQGVDRVTARIAQACVAVGRDPASVRLLPVTKNLPTAWGAALVEAGITTVGENRIDHCQDLVTAGPGLTVEHIGRIQSRQLSKLPAAVTTVHALCEDRHLEKLARVATDQERHFDIYVQVNTSGETQKAGVAPDDLPALLAVARQYPAALSVRGLMTMAPDADLPHVSQEMIAATFAQCRALADAAGLLDCSMGMSKDLELAIQHGATVVRIGTDCWQEAFCWLESFAHVDQTDSAGNSH